MLIVGRSDSIFSTLPGVKGPSRVVICTCTPSSEGIVSGRSSTGSLSISARAVPSASRPALIEPGSDPVHRGPAPREAISSACFLRLRIFWLGGFLEIVCMAGD